MNNHRYLLAAVAAGLTLAGGRAVAQDTAPLAAYGALPAHELVEVSPSGDRLAYITVVGEERALVIHDLNDMSLIGGVRAGPVKVRDLGWVGEDHVYIYSTATQVGASIGLRRSELADASIYEIPTRRVSLALNNTPGVFAKVFGSPLVRTIDGEPSLIVVGSGREGSGLYRINLSNGRGEEHVDPDRRGPPSLLTVDGEPAARVTYDGEEWALQGRRGGFWRTVWRTDARIDTPGLMGFGPTPNSVVLQGAIDGRPDGFYVVDLETGAISDLPFEGRPTSLMHHPATKLLIGARTLGDDDSVT